MNFLEENLNTIVHGDSYELIKLLPDKCIDLIITDPPYLIESTKAGGNSELAKSISKMNKQLENGIFTQSINEEILDEFMRVMKKPNIYIWCNHKQIPMYLDFFVKKNDCSFDIIIWNKTNPTPLFNNKYMTDKEYCLYFRKNGYCNPIDYEHAKTVYYQPLNVKDKKVFNHPTIKPSNIIRNLIENSSLQGDVVFDPFSGSGTTCVVSKELNRNFLGIEIDEYYHRISIDRLNGISGNSQTSIFTDFENL